MSLIDRQNSPWRQQQQFQKGLSGAKIMDDYFKALGYKVEPTSATEERGLNLGDRIMTLPTRKRYYAEYKTDWESDRTGNVWFELLTNKEAGIVGWVYRCQADYLMILLPRLREILVIEPDYLREQIARLILDYPVKEPRHKRLGKVHHTRGCIVPIDRAKLLADKTIKMPQGAR
jgi:hypothetical protein